MLKKYLFACALCAVSLPTYAQLTYTQATAQPVSLQVRYETMPLDILTINAQKGDASAQFYLGKRLMARGELKNAEHWYAQAAKQNLAPAMLNLGVMYLKGQAGSESLGRTLLEKAAQLGDNRASYVLAMLEERSQRLVNAYKWYDLSARNGMLDPKVRDLAQGRIKNLALNLSNQDISRAKNLADQWFVVH